MANALPELFSSSLTYKVLALGLGLALLTLGPVAESQQAAPPPKSASSSVQIVPNRIEFIPPLVKAVLSRDLQQVKEQLATQDINLRLHVKEGRAGFTPLILAAS